MAVRELKDTVPVETLPADAALIGAPSETASTPVLYSADAVAAFIAEHADVVAAIQAIAADTASAATDAAIAALVGGAPAALDTLNELAAALANNADFAATVTAALAAKAPTSRKVSVGTGLSGGGDLSANRTIAANIASQAEAEAGAATTKLMTPQRVAQAIAKLATFSGGVVAGTAAEMNPVALNSRVTKAHGLGGVPTFARLHLVCLTADLSFAPGDTIDLSSSFTMVAVSGAFQVRYTSSSIIIETSNNYPPYIATAASPPGAIAEITLSKWKLVATPYRVT